MDIEQTVVLSGGRRKEDSIEEAAHPRRVMGAFSATMIVVASMVGTGVFTTTGILLETTPSAPAVLIGWLIGGAVAFFGALAYGELVAMNPKNGGEYQILSKVFHPAVGFIAGWVSLIVGFSAPIASAAMAFGAYANASFSGVDPFWAALGVIAALSVIHGVRVTLGAVFQNFFTVLKLLLVAGFIVGGAYLGDFSRITGEQPEETWQVIFSPGFAVGLIYVTYAYTGWNGSAYIAGEIRNPSKSVPLALALGTALVTLVYLGLNTVFLMAAPIDRLTGSIEVGAVAATSLFGESIGRTFSAVIAVLLLSSLSAMVMAGPRIYQSIGEDYPRLRFLGARRGASGPYLAIALQAFISVIMLVSARFDQLITYMGFTLSVSAALTVCGVFVMRRRAPEAPRPYRCWGYPVTPVIFMALSLWMIVFTFIQTPEVAFAGLGTILAGWLVYRAVRPKVLEDARGV